MKTFSLDEAASLLCMHPESLRQKAKSGEVPAAKPGRCWVFLEEDLVAYIRSNYARNRQEVRAANAQEIEVDPESWTLD